ncbi:hypothetical protein HMPREF0591_4825 [Mycobacterium parascrofulaceum ATCC BAA-614]|uniref:DUF1922 domain-containing protein n=1 Tax=Mycobacterium parascrofulaceum ATCC BAA-614 TaxID=525368 RepID=D5PF81_9MYCO|nr:DUF1922 domain-containing protein [Mycobacterium parascrofulaceum]EFG75262.1 hypothetical protein HMPREF0591_4825 [Mycobacterium parascrofulaceum ATCC BAA-614]
MINCQNCGRPAQLYLCNDCTTQLENMLDQIPSLTEELDTRIQKLDRIHHGTIGRNRRPDELNIMDFDAAEIARKLRNTLLNLITDIAQRHTGRTPPALNTVTTANLARWLQANTAAIARLDIAGHTYRTIAQLVGPDQRSGDLIRAIDRHERHFAGTCPTTRGHYPDGDPIECGTMLYADTDNRTTTCPECGQTIDVEKNQRETAKSRDLRTTTEILELLTNIDEPVDPNQLDRWITARRLRTMGWRHDGALVKARVNEHSEALYSLKRAQKLRRRDEQLQRIRRQVKAHQN